MNFEQLKALIVLGNIVGFIEHANSSSYEVVTSRDAYGCSLLDWAVIWGQSAIVTFLSNKYSALVFPIQGRWSALQYAAGYNQLSCLQILLAGRLIDLEHKDHNQKTALELAIQYGYLDCARILLNYGAELPTNIADLSNLINPFKFTLYCNLGGTYQLLSEKEKEDMDLLTTTERLSALTIYKKSKYVRKPYALKMDSKDAENILLTLIDKYLYYCNRIYKEEREKKYALFSMQIQERVELSQLKRESLLKVIRLAVSVIKEHTLDQSSLVSDKTAKPLLLGYIESKQREQKKYFGDDLSDDSDSDENAAYLKQVESDASDDKRINKYVNNLERQNRSFWLRTKMITPQNAGLKKRIMTVSEKIKNGSDNKKQLDTLKDAVKTVLNENLQKRGKIVYADSAVPDENSVQPAGTLNTHRGTSRKSVSDEASEIIKNINSCPPEQLAELLKTKPIFILGTRGINYMLDRWNANGRRYHRRIDELRHPQYCESVLKTLPYDYYTDLDPGHDFHQNNQEEFLLQKEAITLSRFLHSLNDSGPCVATSANHNGNYLFDSVGDCLQDHFSNGVDKHLDDLAAKRFSSPNYWGFHLRNSFNPAVAIGSRPYHALKYTFGLKDYYPRSMMPRYWNDGTIEYSHVGKVYLSLHPLQEILSADGPNNLSILDRQAKVSIGDQISPEKELSFLGFIPGDRVFHQLVAKFPSFKDQWKDIYKVKYGLDKEAYEAFQYLIGITLPETSERNVIVNLLAEWLCAYHEVLLIQVAKDEALRRGGILAYLNRDGKLSLEPENGRIFTRGNANIELRNEVHILRELKILLAEYLSKTSKDERLVPTFNLIKEDDVRRVLEQISKDNEKLFAIASKVQLTTEEEGKIASGESTGEATKVLKSKLIVSNLIKQGLYGKAFTTSYKKQLIDFMDQDHLYTDLEINALLHQGLQDLPDVAIFAAQNPLVEGEFEVASSQLFIDQLSAIFASDQTAVMPVEVSQLELDEDAYLNFVGIHWNGLVISREDNSYRVELIDPAHSPMHDLELTNLGPDEFGDAPETVVELLGLIMTAAAANHVVVRVYWLATEQQQEGDLDCGPWTVDNLICRAQNLPLHTRDNVTGTQLRQLHGSAYPEAVAAEVVPTMKF